MPLIEHAHFQKPIGQSEGQASSTARTGRLRASGTGKIRSWAAWLRTLPRLDPRERLALPGGGLWPVVSVPGPGGIAELLAYGA